MLLCHDDMVLVASLEPPPYRHRSLYILNVPIP